MFSPMCDTWPIQGLPVQLMNVVQGLAMIVACPAIGGSVAFPAGEPVYRFADGVEVLISNAYGEST